MASLGKVHDRPFRGLGKVTGVGNWWAQKGRFYKGSCQSVTTQLDGTLASADLGGPDG